LVERIVLMLVAPHIIEKHSEFFFHLFSGATHLVSFGGTLAHANPEMGGSGPQGSSRCGAAYLIR
jgi:hypothetical protein